MPFPGADMIDASASGVLLSFAEPVVLAPGQRVCLSVPTREGALHLMASVVRVERGHDFHTYVGLVLCERPGTPEVADPDLERWRDWLDDDRFERLVEDERTTDQRRPSRSR